MNDRIKLTEEDFTIHELGESFNHTFAYLEIYVNGSHNLTEIRELKAQILDDNEKVPKLESKLKMMEISFEQINNSRNDLLKQLVDCEMLNKQFKEKATKREKTIGDLLHDKSELKEESNNLKFRLADEQDEINRINGEWRKDKKKLEEIKRFEDHVLYPTEHDKEIIQILEKNE